MPDTKVTNATGDSIGTTIRYVTTLILGMLLARNTISQEFYDAFLRDLPVYMAIIVALIPLAQSLYSKWRARERTETLVTAALDMPEGTTKAELVAAVPPPPTIVEKITGSGKTALPMAFAIFLAMAAIPVALTAPGCQTLGIGGDSPVIDASVSQTQAKRALIELQDARTLVLKSMAAIYVASPNDPAIIASVRRVDSYDVRFREAWQLAALAVDAWDSGLFVMRYNQAKAEVAAMKAEVSK